MIGIGSTDVAVERNAEILSGGLRDSEGDTEDSVSSKIALGGGAVKLDHGLVDGPLLESGHAYDSGSDLVVDVVDSLKDALAAVALGIAVTKFKSLVLTGGSS